ncbi:MAG: alanine--tRNA ligase-related protein [Polyangiales bacterium]
MTETRRLYFDDPSLLTFESRVVSVSAWQGAPAIVLEASAFYPEAGGQLGDHGVLRVGDRVIEIRDVQVDDAGVVHHLVEGAVDAALSGRQVQGEIDRARRTQHRALHTGQHMLSAALIEVAKAETVSSRLGESTCTIDVDVDLGPRGIDEAKIARAEALVNDLIERDVAVRAWFPEVDELAQLHLRRAPKVSERVRVVAVGDPGAWFDVSPCGGTHVTSTAQVAWMRVTGVERYKGKARVLFSAGRRARTELVDEARVLQGLATTFTCGLREVPNAVEKLRRELAEEQIGHGLTRERLAETIAASAQSDRGLVALVIDGASIDLIRAVARRVVSASQRAIAIVGGDAGSDGRPVVIERGADSKLDCGALMKRLVAECAGRGGGRAERAEGRLGNLERWAEAVESVRASG